MSRKPGQYPCTSERHAREALTASGSPSDAQKGGSAQTTRRPCQQAESPHAARKTRIALRIAIFTALTL